MSLPQPVSHIDAHSSDLDLGAFALTQFWQASSQLSSVGWEDFLEMLRRAYYPRDANEAPVGYENWKKVYYPTKSAEALEAFIDGLGLGIRSAELNLSDDDIQTAMHALAKQGHGEIPTNSNAFFGSIQDQSQDYSFYSMASFVASETAAQVGEGLVKIGEDVIDTGKTILAYRNYILVAVVIAAGWYAYTQTDFVKKLLKK